ncbi:cell division protein FtsZ [Flexilinea flocculi]|uniref:Cell division protein FtsZ n=1 Tax=Flexilinea flocculi TaxID=1678840 RepID=A0A0K8PA90_9CHLR|nr:cell division protein FtsZ [Flexilinea flocculi]GAP39573.1 cell division protein FtsZ [Flexilinea flocculi]
MKNSLTQKIGDEIVYNKPVIKVIGLGGGGGNAVSRMISRNFTEVDFIAANTDSQALKSNSAPTKLLIGPGITRGMGCGGNPEIGELAALESESLIREALQGADIVFLTAGMGGGTGSGAIGVAAKIAKDLGAVTISVVNTPFSFESGKRITNARTYLNKLAAHSDTLIAIPNDQLLKIVPRDLSLKESFEIADDVLRQGVLGISQLLTGVGEINVDFSHIRNMMMNGGGSLLTIGYGKGPNKVSMAMYQALNHPLLEHLPIENATGMIVNFTGDENLSFREVVEGMGYLQQLSNHQAEIIPGQIVDNRLQDEVEIILIVTGMASTPLESLNTKPEVKKNSLEREKTSPKTFYSNVAIPDSISHGEETKVLETVLSSTEPMRSMQSIDGPIIPTPNTEKKEFSASAEAAFETFMSPLGLSGYTPASITKNVENSDTDKIQDLDIPTFIRRKM